MRKRCLSTRCLAMERLEDRCFLAAGDLLQTLYSPTPQKNAAFGWAVATDGDLAVVGAPFADFQGVTSAGLAYILNARTGQALATLSRPSPEGSDKFGSSVALSGQRVVVGAIWAGADNHGEAYVFDALTGSLVSTLRSPNPVAGEAFGAEVAIWGNTVLVSAFFAGGNGQNGKVYVFDAPTGNCTATLVSPRSSVPQNGWFGKCLAIEGDRAVISENGLFESGHAGLYVFDIPTGNVLHSLDFWTDSVAISGGVIAAGVLPASTGERSVLVIDAASGAVMQTLHSPMPASEWFGYSLALSGDALLVGSPGYRTPAGAASPSSAYLYSVDTGTLVSKLDDPNPNAGDDFGFAVAMSGDLALVGAPENDTAAPNAGAAYVFDTSGPVFTADGQMLYDPVSSIWWWEDGSGSLPASLAFGPPGEGWDPLVGDWNAGGHQSPGLYDPATSTWHLTNGTGTTDLVIPFGAAGAGWRPVVGDWDGDGVATPGLYDPKTSLWYLTKSLKGGVAELKFGFGAPDAGWLPVAGDWNGDGADTIGLYDPATAVCYLRNSHASGEADVSFAFGAPDSGWSPIAGDWNADGVDTIGLYDAIRSSSYLRNSNTSGIADLVVGFGAPEAGWRPARGNSDCLTQAIDNGADARYSTDGQWSAPGGLGFRGDADRSTTGNGADRASWEFRMLPGRYTAAATWAAQNDLALTAPYTIYDGATALGTVRVNQRLAPQDFTDQQVGWKDLGTFEVTSGWLVVALADNATGPVMADAIRVQRIGAADLVIAGGLWE